MWEIVRDVPVGFVPTPTPLIWGSVMFYLRSPKGGCSSISDDLSCSGESYMVDTCRGLIEQYDPPPSKILHVLLEHNDALDGSDIMPTHDIVSDRYLLTDLYEYFHRTLAPIMPFWQGQIFPWTPGPFSFRTCLCYTFWDMNFVSLAWFSRLRVLNIPLYFFLTSHYTQQLFTHICSTSFTWM